ncbi:hypothetical protein LWI28_010383 [Acer negundo]|uniref:Reverse transcriptase n=1 Tax=Acer negundo TaxID=4023 RepID=A0AAD5JST6_ACENE|nr:hypothetical protein LWI28_010383 [Acer negundo]
MCKDLEAAFTAEEIKDAIFSMGPTKALCPDGFQAIFFQKFCGVIGVDITMICLNVLNGLSYIRDFNSTNVVLISKVKNPTSLKDFRQISASKTSCDRIRNILRIYEKGSGQQVNIQKSMATFSPNVEQAVKLDILNFLGIGVHNTQDKYLGLPTMVGRNKRSLFNNINERLWKKIRSQKGDQFSFDGKEVLIKAVAQVIPSYAMSIFKLPSSLCKKMTTMISKFWWGSRDGNRKISWVKWDSICRPKSCEGFGFKDLSLFNHALLANQAWRILKNPETLASQILRVKYFKGYDFLHAPINSGCSYIWRSIGWGRSLS